MQAATLRAFKKSKINPKMQKGKKWRAEINKIEKKNKSEKI